jgi:phenylalanine-4-hydroxylase
MQQVQNQNTIKIPAHLKRYVVEQQYEKYTEVDHQVWRHVMRRNHEFLKDVAHPAYVDGLRKTGIGLDRIPRVEEMNECLQPFGWGAVTIDGLIPGVAFFDFQAHGILPIAAEIRRPEHIEYTPTPDIIHEAGGHAPILSDELYAKYVKVFGRIGSKAIATKEEHEAFEAARHYSILMEEKTASEEEIKAAEEVLEAKQAAIRGISEAEQISRLYWWTVEYGLIGDLRNPRIYGAGLLSSIGESKHCLTDAVRKIPFSLEETIQTGFNITRKQPQLFVCESFEELIEAVETFGEQMAFAVGGTRSLEKAMRSGTTATVQYSSGLQVTGTVANVEYDGRREAVYVVTSGPSALAFRGQELSGHGKATHSDGFSSPIGRLQNVDVPLERLTVGELESLGIQKGKHITLKFESGVEVSGVVENIMHQDGKLLLLSFSDCTVMRHSKILFRPEWGMYDMAIGESITSVFSGAADSEAFFGEN